MAEIKKLRGGAPVNSLILVNVDNETIAGSGSLRHPLHTVGGGGAITTEHLSITGTSGTLAVAKELSFVDYTGVIPEGPLIVSMTLPDGTVDGQQKQVAFAWDATNVTWRLMATANGTLA